MIGIGVILLFLPAWCFWWLACVAFALVVFIELREGFLEVIAACAFEQQFLGESVILRRQ